MNILALASFLVGCLVFVVVALVAARRRKRSGASEAARSALLQLAQRAGASGGDPNVRGGALRFTASGEVFRINASEFTKQRPRTYWLGTELPSVLAPGAVSTLQMKRLPHVVCRVETDLDRFGKRLGLNREPHTGDEAFDRSFYIEATGRSADIATLIELGAFRDAAREVAAIGGDLVVNAEGHAVAMRLPIDAPAIAPEAMDRVVQALATLTGALPPLEDRTLRGVERRMLGEIGALGAIMPLAGVAYLSSKLVRVLDDGFLTLSLQVMGALFGVGVIVLWLASRGRPRGLARLAVGLGVVIATAPSLSVAGLTLTNWIGDRSSTRVVLPVEETHTTHGSKNRKYYWITVGGEGTGVARSTLSVTASGYAALDKVARKEQRVELELGNGNLGYRWLRAIRIARLAAP